MTTSPKTAFLSEILEHGKQIPAGKLAYFRARLKNRLHEVVLNYFVALDINKADLARKLGRKPEQITRWLGSPGNWTLDTLSDLLLGMGCEPSLSLTKISAAPEDKPSQFIQRSAADNLQSTQFMPKHIKEALNISDIGFYEWHDQSLAKLAIYTHGQNPRTLTSRGDTQEIHKKRRPSAMDKIARTEQSFQEMTI